MYSASAASISSDAKSASANARRAGTDVGSSATASFSSLRRVDMARQAGLHHACQIEPIEPALHSRGPHVHHRGRLVPLPGVQQHPQAAEPLWIRRMGPRVIEGAAYGLPRRVWQLIERNRRQRLLRTDTGGRRHEGGDQEDVAAHRSRIDQNQPKAPSLASLAAWLPATAWTLSRGSGVRHRTRGSSRAVRH